MRVQRNQGIIITICLFILIAHGWAFSNEWTHWRGPNQNGFVDDGPLPDAWSKEGENLIWHASYGGRIAPIVMGGRVYLINRAGEGETLQERVMALDFKTGKLLWEYRFNVFLTDIVKHRLGWANLAGDPETGNIYAQGVQGLFVCLDKNGKVLWSHSLTEEFGRISGYGGRTHSPIVEGDMVIMGCMNSSWGPHAKPTHRFIAVDKRSGEIIWWSSTSGAPLDTTYSVPVVATINGVRTLISGIADGSIQALKVHTGELIWKYQLSKRGINTSVVYNDGRVYACHSEENLHSNVMGSLVCLDATKTGDISKTGELWKIEGLGAGYSSPAYHDGLLYVADNSANLHCIDAQTGKSYWSFNYGNAAKGSPTYADGKIYIGEEGGKYHVLRVSKESCRRLNEVSFSKPNGSPIEITGSPAVVDGRVLLLTKEDLYCIGNKDYKPGAAKLTAKTAIGIVPGPLAHLQIIPAETWIDSGTGQAFKARGFDAKGNLIGETQAEWSVKGLEGTIDKNGHFKARETHATQGGTVVAKVGGLTASARLRIIPPLPYSEDFERVPENRPPPGWISAPSKSRVVSMDGSKVLKKLADNPNPPLARMRNYIMPPRERGFTIQADMYGKSKKKRFLPDMGLLNCRYKLIILGTSRKRQVRLVTWDPMPRLQVEVEYPWEPDRWYTAKLKFDIRDGKGLVQAKVWPRDEAEPSDWTIEMWDPIPNTGGSPGLYAYSVAITDSSPGTEVFFDNVRVRKNE